MFYHDRNTFCFRHVRQYMAAEFGKSDRLCYTSTKAKQIYLRIDNSWCRVICAFGLVSETM